MRIYTNQQKIKTNRRNAQILFFTSLAILMGGLLITNLGPRDNTFLIVVPCLVMPIGLFTTFVSVRLTNQYVRDPHPEDALQAAMKGMNQNSAMYNYLFKANHVVVSPDGVFTFVTRFQDGPIRIDGENVVDPKASGPLGKVLSFMRQEQIGKPFEEAREAAQVIQAILNDEGQPVEVKPVVAFISPKARIEVNQPAVSVIVTRKDKEPSLKNMRRENKRDHGQLSNEQVMEIEKILNAQLSIEGEAKETTETVEDTE